jgi:hypothetical protein
MALDFPTNPTNGQVYDTFYYDSSIRAWRNLGSKNALTSSITAVSNSIGLKDIIPTSVVVGSGSATVNANGTVTFSAATSISLNGVFNSTYRNYKIVISVNQASALSHMWLRLRNAGTDGSGPCYTGAQIINQLGTSASYAQNGGVNVHLGYITSMSSQKYGAEVTIHAPAIAVTSSINFLSSGVDAAYVQNLAGGALYDNPTAYDGLTLLPSTGAATFSGTVQVFGYTN